jgi:hypothetical protein
MGLRPAKLHEKLALAGGTACQRRFWGLRAPINGDERSRSVLVDQRPWARQAFHQCAGPAFGGFDGVENPGNAHSYFRPVPPAQNDDGNSPMGEILLVLKTFVGGQQDVEPRVFGGVQQFPVCQAVPPAFRRRRDCVVPQEISQRNGSVMVKQNSHARVLEGCRRRS